MKLITYVNDIFLSIKSTRLAPFSLDLLFSTKKRNLYFFSNANYGDIHQEMHMRNFMVWLRISKEKQNLSIFEPPRLTWVKEERVEIINGENLFLSLQNERKIET